MSDAVRNPHPVRSAFSYINYIVYPYRVHPPDRVVRDTSIMIADMSLRAGMTAT